MKKKTNKKKCKNDSCNKSFVPFRSTDKFCSYKCMSEYAKKEQLKLDSTGEKSKYFFQKKRAAYQIARQSEKTQAGNKVFAINAAKLREQIIEKQGYISCQRCDRSGGTRFETHHIIFRSEKPNHEHLHNIENLILLCSECHQHMHDHKSERNPLVELRGLADLFGFDVLDK